MRAAYIVSPFMHHQSNITQIKRNVPRPSGPCFDLKYTSELERGRVGTPSPSLSLYMYVYNLAYRFDFLT